MDSPGFKNRLLAKLGPDILRSMSGSLEIVTVSLKRVLIEANTPIAYVYFPEDCVCSVLAMTGDTQPIEVGMIGYEGMTDMVLREGRDTSPLRIIVQVPGSAARLTARDFSRAIRQHPSVSDLTLRFKEALAIQFAFTAFAHGTFTIEQRLARWLLMSHDRRKGEPSIPLVHEFMAAMLAVRRSGVTTAIHVLEGQGAIRATRGIITIRDRQTLESIAGDSYGVPENEYERLMAD